ncbi:hypothetical protein INT47_007869 [Mucor saturninus]|uniref:Uncharacterized protein n=1 Tax=Mucor saturninus TaxID=64648 RepID=A0A8H7QKH3_9FUNG|nr:hypothetical protein INT47_007869 [Mucor saturninus]
MTDRLLDLQLYDPSIDTPVEVLHTILLRICKYLVVDLVKCVLKIVLVLYIGSQTSLDSAKKNVLDYLENLQDNCGIVVLFWVEILKPSSKLLRIINIHGSRIARLAIIRTVGVCAQGDSPCDERNIRLLNITRTKLSLWHLRNVICGDEFRFSRILSLLSTVDTAIKDFIVLLHFYDWNNNIPGHNARTGKVKIHLLTHFPQDIRRFGTVMQYEIEKLNPSQDVRLKFVKQSMMRHVIEGSSGLNMNGITEKAGEDVISLIPANDDRVYLDLLGGSRDFINTVTHKTGPTFRSFAILNFVKGKTSGF